MLCELQYSESGEDNPKIVEVEFFQQQQENQNPYGISFNLNISVTCDLAKKSYIADFQTLRLARERSLGAIRWKNCDQTLTEVVNLELERIDSGIQVTSKFFQAESQVTINLEHQFIIKGYLEFTAFGYEFSYGLRVRPYNSRLMISCCYQNESKICYLLLYGLDKKGRQAIIKY